ncbi:LINE-1 retrotransposable element ORF2 protein [Vitis vinifera]|uniref:LINE-1 retrotransposable element ORF2 protein n=1 Tax=Vitis vinifera TaxID=29760 RepID=A0A438JBE4_VITVI|nr:LINE-1 retrotransposable element ORF2 protein [Vitis vinifera]
MFSFGRTPEGEFFDHSGEGREICQIDRDSQRKEAEGSRASGSACWELVEFKGSLASTREQEVGPPQNVIQDGRGEKELDWQESSLARFSLFLGFSTDGMEKEILNFLSKIRKRREKIHSKGLLEKSRFERELKRLECSVNYEGDSKKKGSFQGKGMQMMKQKVDLFCIQETKIQLMSESVVRSLGSGRFLEWKALNACGSAGGMLICWDKRVLELLEWEGGAVGGGRAIRGIWEGPWCLGGDFNITLAQGERNRQGRITSAMRRFAEVVDDLGLVDIQLHGGAFTWTGGLNNMSRARLDRFLVSPCCLISSVGWSRGPAPFRFENMWFKVEGFKELIRNWWQETVVRGSASFRLSEKLKVLKQKLKIWNREEFGNLESNKEAAMQQVDFWDRVEEERSLSMEESACKKEAKEAYAKWVELEETHWSRCWDFIKEEILELFKEFHDQNTFLKSINNTFLVLIPKKGGAEDFGDFRPISLLGGLYKLVAKVLANRLKKVIDKVVSHDQNAFVKGRQILDASLIANEVIDSWKKKGDKGVICKLDIEKAYDSINWNFLLKVMEKMGFGAKWLRWVWWCISTAKFSVMVNGSPAGFFSSSKGCVKEIPWCKIQRNRGRAVHIAHLLFADDTIVFCEAKKEYLTNLSWILFWFEAASGLKINLAKSEVIPVGEVQRIEELAVELGCRVGKLPSIYLGLPLGVPNKATYGWDGIEERTRRRLALWKSQYISKGGRITLIKALWVRFLASGFGDSLRIRRLFGNMCWKQSMVRRVHGWRTKKAVGACGVGVWKEILKEADWCWDKMGFKVGKGNKISFWTDVWCEELALSQRFPHLYTLAADRNAKIEDLWDQNVGEGGWNLRFIRDFNDWEVELVGELLQALRGVRISWEDDSVFWKGGGSGSLE